MVVEAGLLWVSVSRVALWVVAAVAVEAWLVSVSRVALWKAFFTCDSAFAFCAEAAFENSAAFGGCEDDDAALLALDALAAAFSANCFFFASCALRNSSKSFSWNSGL